MLFLAADVAIARRLARTIITARRPLASGAGRRAVELRVVAWPRLDAEHQRAICGAVVEHASARS